MFIKLHFIACRLITKHQMYLIKEGTRMSENTSKNPAASQSFSLWQKI